MNELKQTWYSRENRNKSGSALMMVVLMLMSTQMYNFIGVEEETTNLETVEQIPARTAYQQFYQAEGQTTGATQGQLDVMSNFDHEAFTDPSWVDPASYQGKITDPSVLLTNPGYGFFLEQKNFNNE